MTKRKSADRDELDLIFNLLAKNYLKLRETMRAVGVRDLASSAYQLISTQFVSDAAEAPIAAYDGLVQAARRFLKKQTRKNREDIKGDGTQELTYGGHEFAFLNAVYMVARGDDSYAVPLEELTADECGAIVSRLESEAQTKAAEADEMVIFMKLRFGIDRKSAFNDDDHDDFQPSAS